MNKWKALAGSLVLSSVMAAPAMVMASPDGDHGPHHHKQRMFEHIADELDLTEGQKAQLKANREASKEAFKARREAMHEAHKALRDAVSSGADQATLDSLGAKIGALEVQKAQEMEKQRTQFEAILTDEQKTRLEEMKAERKERFEKRKQRWRDRDSSDE